MTPAGRPKKLKDGWRSPEECLGHLKDIWRSVETTVTALNCTSWHRGQVLKLTMTVLFSGIDHSRQDSTGSLW